LNTKHNGDAETHEWKILLSLLRTYGVWV